ncbi:cupin domain-containing protein [Candidatus Pacearchaeota archaeon]|jgi:mannose-6-phosphate isomerase-like protein (cupin superfamily)|nr:cupin domain-containing protein [Candidatus Pacearchaeota archaeon]
MTIKKVNKIWGNEEWIVNTDKYCGKILNVKKGKRGSLHYHKNKDETFYILKGKILMESITPENINGQNYNIPEIRVMKEGDVKHITPLMKHRYSGLEESVIIEFSTHHEDSDTYREEDSSDVSKIIMEYFNKR